MQQALDTIIAALGEKAVLSAPRDMEKYLDDLQGVTATRPIAVLRPDCTDQVAAAVKWCRSNHLSIVPQGGLTGLTGAAVPTGPAASAIISLERMNAIREVDLDNNSMTVDAGVVLARVQAAAKQAGRYFPLHHGGQESSQIGGNLATNAGGINALRYGTARDQVLGLEVVLPDGTIWNGLRKLRKNTAGYDLKHLFIGSEGTLGLITGAVLKLGSYPHNRTTAFVAIASVEAALHLLHILKDQLGEVISVFELMSKAALNFGEAAGNTRRPLDQHSDWYLLVEAETSAKGFDLEEALMAALFETNETGLVQDAAIAQSASQRQDFWNLREAIAAGFVDDKSTIKCDTAVPVAALPEYLRATADALTKYLPGVRPVPFGHLGDGNIHFNIARPIDMDAETFMRHRAQLSTIVEQEALKLNGTISAEHGIGSLKKHRFEKETDPIELSLLKNVRRAFDPDGHMNPNVSVY